MSEERKKSNESGRVRQRPVRALNPRAHANEAQTVSDKPTLIGETSATDYALKVKL